MVPHTENEVLDFLEALQGQRPEAYLGHEMKTWVVKEHRVRLAGHEAPSFLGMFGDGRFILFDRESPDAEPEVLRQGHVRDLSLVSAPQTDTPSP
jgi:hypothetical protein